MQTSKLSLLLTLAGAAALQVHAQPASPEAQSRALELLRQTISQEQGRPSTTSQPTETPSVIMPVPTEAPMPSGNFTPATSDLQEQAIMLLRQQVAQHESAGAAPVQPRSRTSRSAAKPANTRRPAQPPSAVNPAPPVEPVAPVTAPLAGPRTKQQRLMDLLEQYRADKLTPAEYQAERAKILAEP